MSDDTTPRTAVVIPADPAQPISTVTWTGGGLVSVLYTAIGCDTVECWPLPTPGKGVTAWADEEGAYRQPVNDRAVRFHAELGELASAIYGTVVLTGSPAADGDTLGLSDQLAADLIRTIGGPA